MQIDKDKMTLMRIALRQAGNSGDIEAAYDALLRKVAAETSVAEVKDQKRQTSVFAQKKKKKRIKYIFTPSQCLKILEALILLDKHEPHNKTLAKAAQLAIGDNCTSSYDAGPYLIANGYLERQGAGRNTIWTILKNPDGTPYSKNQNLTITVLPPGQAYGYGQKDDRPAFNPAYRDQTR